MDTQTNYACPFFYKLVDKKLLIPASIIKMVRLYRLGDEGKHPF
jgi:hypothetical protein